MSDPTHVYLNLDVVNNSTTNAQPLVFNETRNMPFLTNSENYFCSVVRFTLQTSNSLPVFIPDILTGQDDVDRTVYAISMSLSKYTRDGSGTITATDTFGASKYIDYKSLDFTQPEPAPPLTRVDTSSTYYFIYNINDWVDMVNDAFKILTLDIIQKFQDAGKPVSFKKPFITYDISSGLFTIHSDNSMDVIGSSGVYDLKIAFNSRLYNILPFSAKLERLPPLGAPFPDTTYILNLFNKSDANVSVVYSSSDKAERYIILQTEFSPLPLLNPIRNIYFTTNTLPIQPTLASPPKVIGDTNIATGSVSGDILNIITDYSLAVSASNNYNGEIIYQPAGELRLIELNSVPYLNRVDISAFWEDRRGQSYPIYLPSGANANLKLLFRHKKYNFGSTYYS
jgi:hypothetical protein